MRLTVVHDVTRERTLRDELIETEERFRQFADLVDDAIFVVTPGLEHVLYANGRFEAIWGLSTAQFAARPAALLELVPAAQRTEVAALFEGDATTV